MYFFALITDLKSIVIPPKLSNEHAHSQKKTLTVSWFIHTASQATQNKKLIQP